MCSMYSMFLVYSSHSMQGCMGAAEYSISSGALGPYPLFVYFEVFLETNKQWGKCFEQGWREVEYVNTVPVPKSRLWKEQPRSDRGVFPRHRVSLASSLAQHDWPAMAAAVAGSGCPSFPLPGALQTKRFRKSDRFLNMQPWNPTMMHCSSDFLHPSDLHPTGCWQTVLETHHACMYRSAPGSTHLHGLVQLPLRVLTLTTRHTREGRLTPWHPSLSSPPWLHAVGCRDSPATRFQCLPPSRCIFQRHVRERETGGEKEKGGETRQRRITHPALDHQVRVTEDITTLKEPVSVASLLPC